MPTTKLIRIREPKCGQYQSINHNVIKHYLDDHKLSSLQKCIKFLFHGTFNITVNIDLQNDNINKLKQMELLETKNFSGNKYPKLIKELDTKKNKGLTPFQFQSASHEKVYWKCLKDHSWLASIASRSHGGNNCPECGSRKLNTENNLAVKFPKLILEWNYIKND